MGLRAAVVRYIGGEVLEAHAHEAGSVSIVLAGLIEEEVGRRTEVGRVGSIVAKPAGVEHCNRVGRDGAILLAINGPEADAIALEWRWSRSRGAGIAGLRVARGLGLGGVVEVDQLLDLLAFADGPNNARRQPAWLDDIRRRLDRDLVPPPVAALAELADVHPVYLARAFRGRFGCSIREYRRHVRVCRAADLLAGSSLPIAAIAAKLDFFDQSHLCRDFKAELAVSPGDSRAILRR